MNMKQAVPTVENIMDETGVSPEIANQVLKFFDLLRDIEGETEAEPTGPRAHILIEKSVTTTGAILYFCKDCGLTITKTHNDFSFRVTAAGELNNPDVIHMFTVVLDPDGAIDGKELPF